MAIVFGGLVGVVVVAGFVVGLYAWFKCAYFLLTLPRHKKPEVPWSDVPWGSFNHFNIVMAPQYLTDEGRRNLKKLGAHLVLFVAAVGIPMALSTLFQK